MVTKRTVYCDDGSHGRDDVPAVKKRLVDVCAKCDARIESEEHKHSANSKPKKSTRKKSSERTRPTTWTYGPTIDRVLTEVRKAPGLAPREYGARLHLSASAVSSAGRALKRMGLIRVEGLRAAAKYYPTNKDMRAEEERQTPEPEMPRTPDDPGDAARQAVGWPGARA